MSGLLEGRLAVVTGGTRGIGRAVVDRFVTEGADVVVTGRNQASGDETASAHPGRVHFVRSDVTRSRDRDGIAARVAALGRPIDTVVATVGGGESTWSATSTPDEIAAVLDVTFTSALFTVQRLLPAMRDGATIVLLGSTAGSSGSVGMTAYSASKAAVRSLARSLTSELRPRRIRANVVTPGPTQTEGFDAVMAGDESRVESLRRASPVGRIGRPEEIAAAILFMASDESSYVAGAELVCDGGLTQV